MLLTKIVLAKKFDSVQQVAMNIEIVSHWFSKPIGFLLVAPVSVALDKRTFCKLKIIKNYPQSKMKDELACETVKTQQNEQILQVHGQ